MADLGAILASAQATMAILEGFREDEGTEVSDEVAASIERGLVEMRLVGEKVAAIRAERKDVSDLSVSQIDLLVRAHMASGK